MLSIPLSPSDLSTGEIIANRLEPLIGRQLNLTGKSRTDGSQARKLISSQLEPFYPDISKIQNGAVCAEKGVPKLKRELLDTYIVTSGTNYNLQIWNRLPNSNETLIDYGEDGCLTCADVKLAFIRINPETNIIESIIVTTPGYIEEMFGKFGVPTVKWQLIISDSKRKSITKNNPPIFVAPDIIKGDILSNSVEYHSIDMFDEPEAGKIASTESLTPVLIDTLLGKVIEPASTKNRGQELEYQVISMLNYEINPKSTLAGGYPDLPNQALEIKIQDSPTVDLGKFTPQIKTEIYADLGINTENVRYLIVLMNPTSNEVEGFILAPGKTLGEEFTYVADKNFKCQRSIPMSFFESYKGKSAFLQ